jgi:ABC-type transport system substrate-binding protein
MRRLWRTLNHPVYVPLVDKAEDTYRALSRSGRTLFIFFSGLLIISVIGLLSLLNSQLIVAIPGYGGGMTEGIVGSPRFINPVLAVSDADRDLTSLVYSGLLRATPDGEYVSDLADHYSVSPDGLTYTFVLKDNAKFHDGKPVTADDVVFTVEKVQDAAVKSPLLANWTGVGVAATDPKTVEFTLKSAYAPFVDNLTLGILPKHLWQNVSDDEFPFSELNTSPVGSGPFKVSSISRTPAGIPSSYDLSAFGEYALGKPYFSYFTLKFYQSEDAVAQALARGDVEAASGLSPATLGSLTASSASSSIRISPKSCATWTCAAHSTRASTARTSSRRCFKATARRSRARYRRASSRKFRALRTWTPPARPRRRKKRSACSKPRAGYWDRTASSPKRPARARTPRPCASPFRFRPGTCRS